VVCWTLLETRGRCLLRTVTQSEPIIHLQGSKSKTLLVLPEEYSEPGTVELIGAFDG